jgi:hypothetical protein
MNGKQVKKLKKKLLTDTEKILLLIRNEYGSLTQQMTEKQVYRITKKFYKQGKIKL